MTYHNKTIVHKLKRVSGRRLMRPNPEIRIYLSVFHKKTRYLSADALYLKKKADIFEKAVNILKNNSVIAVIYTMRE